MLHETQHIQMNQQTGEIGGEAEKLDVIGMLHAQSPQKTNTIIYIKRCIRALSIIYNIQGGSAAAGCRPLAGRVKVIR